MNKWNRANHRQNHIGKHGSVCFPTDTGRQIHFLAGHSTKTQDKYSLELLTKMTLKVPKWASYIFDLTLLEKLWQVLKMVV